jgi:hypothetical protein
MGSEVICLQVRYIISSSYDMELEFEHCWSIGLPLEVPILGLEDAHRFVILSTLHVRLGTGGAALLLALQFSHCSDRVVERHRLGWVSRA